MIFLRDMLLACIDNYQRYIADLEFRLKKGLKQLIFRCSPRSVI
jgi:hypothetical protein